MKIFALILIACLSYTTSFSQRKFSLDNLTYMIYSNTVEDVAEILRTYDYQLKDSTQFFQAKDRVFMNYTYIKKSTDPKKFDVISLWKRYYIKKNYTFEKLEFRTWDKEKMAGLSGSFFMTKTIDKQDEECKLTGYYSEIDAVTFLNSNCIFDNVPFYKFSITLDDFLKVN